MEDNAISLKLVKFILTNAGYDVLEAPDGRTALELMASRRPDLVIQDLMLPDIDGLDLVRRLRQIGGGSVPIIAFSGYLALLEEAEGIRGGFDACLSKPVEPTALLRTVQAYLECAQGANATVERQGHTDGRPSIHLWEFAARADDHLR